jgi:glycosyltransferase involved in cell wall biosynthesis
VTRALLLSEHDLADWQRRFAAGEVPSALPYGVDVLTSIGYQLHGTGRSTGPLGSKLRDAVEHRTGLAVERAVRAVGAVRSADVVLALLEREGMLPGLWKRAGLPPYAGTPLVIWSCWLADDIRRADADGRARLRRRIEAADLITHLSRHETEIFVDLGIPAERLFPVTYGVSHRYYVPPDDADATRDIEILAVGQDRGRDYATLVEAVRGTDLTVEVVCKPENVAGLDIPANVRVHPPVDLPAYRSLLRRAQVVAVPTVDLAYPTGSSVALESAATGCCVVVSGTRSMRELFTDRETGRVVEVGDVDGWRDMLRELRGDADQRGRLGAGARRSVEQRFNADHMWTEMAEVMAARGLVPPPAGRPRS